MAVSLHSTTTGTRNNEGTVNEVIDAGSNVKGILVMTAGSTGNGRPGNGGVTWNGVSLTQLSSGFVGSGETGSVYAWFIGSGTIATGSNTLTITSASWTGNYAVYILNGDDDLEIVDEQTVDNTTGTTHTVSMTLSSRTCFIAAGGFSGASLLNTNPLSGWTFNIEEQKGSGTALQTSYDTIGSTDTDAGFTNNVDDGYVLAAAIAEVGGAGGIEILRRRRM